ALLHHARAGDVVVGIVHGVGETEAPDSVAGERPERERHELRARRLPGYEAESRRHELQGRTRRRGRHEPDALPGILFLVADGYAHVRRGGEVDRFVTDAVHHRRDRQRIRSIDTERGPETLIPVTQRGLDDLNVSHEKGSPLSSGPVSTDAPRSPCPLRRPRIPGRRALERETANWSRRPPRELPRSPPAADRAPRGERFHAR